MRELLPTLVEDNTNYTISTDLGKEFSRLDQGGIPASAVHRLKDGKNAISVLDRAMQTVKVDSASAVIDGDAKNWVDALQLATSGYNKRPHESVFGPPEQVEKGNGVQDFKVLQSNSNKWSFNRNAQHNKSNSLKSAGAFRAPIPSKRSFEPRYGDVRMLGPMRRGEGTFLLKQIQDRTR